MVHIKMKHKEHLTPEGLRKIVAIKAAMNLGLSDKLKKGFPDVVPVVRPIVELPQTIDPNWLAGFTSAEGCFHITVTPYKTKVGYDVSLVLTLTQHIRDEPLMVGIKEFLGCGYIVKYRNAIDCRVTKFDDIVKKIIPFFQKYKLKGVKSMVFADWCKAAQLMKKKNI